MIIVLVVTIVILLIFIAYLLRGLEEQSNITIKLYRENEKLKQTKEKE